MPHHRDRAWRLAAAEKLVADAVHPLAPLKIFSATGKKSGGGDFAGADRRRRVLLVGVVGRGGGADGAAASVPLQRSRRAMIGHPRVLVFAQGGSGFGVPESPGDGPYRLTATLVRRGPAAAVVLDDEQVAAVGEGAKRFPVMATVNDYTWRTTVTRMQGEFLLGLNREVREGAGVDAGDCVEIEVALDAAPREVDVPEALASALDGDPVAGAAFKALAYTHRKEYARWIDNAKRDETRRRRIERALQMLRAAETRS